MNLFLDYNSEIFIKAPAVKYLDELGLFFGKDPASGNYKKFFSVSW